MCPLSEVWEPKFDIGIFHLKIHCKTAQSYRFRFRGRSKMNFRAKTEKFEMSFFSNFRNVDFLGNCFRRKFFFEHQFLGDFFSFSSCDPGSRSKYKNVVLEVRDSTYRFNSFYLNIFPLTDLILSTYIFFLLT